MNSVPVQDAEGLRAEVPDLRRITVVLPTYNRAESVRRCVLGILACDVEGLEVELRVVDDGSPDNTAEVIEEVRRRYDGPIRLVYDRQPNAGQSSARNRAIRAAETDVLLFIDDDCVPDPGWIRGLVSADWSPGVGAVGGRLVAAQKGNWISDYCRYIRYNEFPPDDGPLTFVNSANCAYLARALQEVDGYECSLPRGVDHDLGWRVMLAGYRMLYQPEAVVHHFHRESLRVVLKDCWTRGASNTVRSQLWASGKPVTPLRLLREYWVLALSLLDLLALPWQMAQIAREGVAPRNWLPYALLGWTRRAAGRCGKISMLRRILKGRQPLQRSSRVVKRVPPPPHAPHWVRASRE
ncbi:MAG: glycosyltransferase [Armatimonadota bacterium]